MRQRVQREMRSDLIFKPQRNFNIAGKIKNAKEKERIYFSDLALAPSLSQNT